MLDSNNSPPSVEDVFTVLGNSRRRQVILQVAHAQNPIPASEIARDIAATEHDTTPGRVTGEQRSRVYIALIQTHFPLMDELGLIEFGDETRIVSETNNTQPLANLIEFIRTACNAARGDT